MSAAGSVLAGLRVGGARLRGKTGLLVLLAALAATLVVAVLERHAGVVGAADRTLVGLFRLVVPISCFAFLQLAIGMQNLREAAWPVARYGHHRGLVALGVVLAGAFAAAGSALLLAWLGLSVARLFGPAMPNAMPFISDLAATSFTAVAVSLGYGSWLGLGATFGRLGGGRTLVLLADFLVGSVGFFAVALPRGAAYSLIGREAALELSARQSSLVLVAVTLLCFWLTVLRCRR